MKNLIRFTVLILIIVTCGCEIDKVSRVLGSPTSLGNTDSSGGLLSISFDDGRRSTYNNAFPILDRVGLKTTNYIITGRFNDPNYMGKAEVLGLQSRGHEIGAHTRTHQDLTQMTTSQIENEVVGSRSDLLSIGVRSVETFAYPFGIFNGTVVQVVRNAGFQGARTTNPGFNVRATDKFLLMRLNLRNTTSITQVQSSIDTALQNRTWLILVSHYVDQTNSELSITPEFLQQIVDEIVKKRIKVVTISEGLKMMISP